MDDSTFDTLTRSFATPSRRAILSALGAALLAALVDRGSTTDSLATKKRPSHGNRRSYAASKHVTGAGKKNKRHDKRKKKRRGNKRDASPNDGLPADDGLPPGCVPQCATTKPCGPDTCGGSCGSCSGNDACVSGQCACTPQCLNKDCGDSGCGFVCGACEHTVCSTTDCSSSGQCIATPIPGCCTFHAECATNNPCTTDSCVSGTCQHAPKSAGTTCARPSSGAGVCDGAGLCVQCVSDTDCDDDNPCTTNTCTNQTCQYPLRGSGASCTRATTGTAGVCDEVGRCVECLEDSDCGPTKTCELLGAPGSLEGRCHPCGANSGGCERKEQCCSFYTYVEQPGMCDEGRCCGWCGEVCSVEADCCPMVRCKKEQGQTQGVCWTTQFYICD